MPGPIDVLDITYRTAVDLSENIHRVAVINDNGDIVLPSASGVGKIAGILQDKPGYNQPNKIGKAAKIRKMGLSKVEIASTVNIGDNLEIADTFGRVKKATPPTATYQGKLIYVIGTAEQNGSASGELILAAINPFSYTI